MFCLLVKKKIFICRLSLASATVFRNYGGRKVPYV